MTQYPGEDPNAEHTAPITPEQPQSSEPPPPPPVTLPPVAPPAQTGPVWNPSSAQYGPTPGQGQGQGQSPGQVPPPPPYGASTPPYGQAPGYGQYGAFQPPAPAHPRATTSMVLGIIGLASLVICGIGLVVSPFAWAFGQSALREIKDSGGRLGGESQARAGQIMGIIGTVLLVLAIVLLVVFIVGVANSTTSSDASTSA